LAGIAYHLNESKQKVDYHLKTMSRNKTIRKVKDAQGHTMYYLREEFVADEDRIGVEFRKSATDDVKVLSKPHHPTTHWDTHHPKPSSEDGQYSPLEFSEHSLMFFKKRKKHPA